MTSVVRPTIFSVLLLTLLSGCGGGGTGSGSTLTSVINLITAQGVPSPLWQNINGANRCGNWATQSIGEHNLDAVRADFGNRYWQQINRRRTHRGSDSDR